MPEPKIKGYNFVTNEDLERFVDGEGLLIVGSSDSHPDKTLAQHYAERLNIPIDHILINDSTLMPGGKSIYIK